MLDLGEIRLHVRHIAQGDGHGVAHLVADAKAVQAGRELAGIGGHHEHQHHRHHGQVLQHDIELIKKLLRRHGVASRDMEKLRPGAVNRTALKGRKQINDHDVEAEEQEDELENRSHLLPFRFGDLKDHQTENQHDDQDPGVIGQHAGHGPQDKKQHLRHAGQPVDPGILLRIGKQSSHLPSPPFQNG